MSLKKRKRPLALIADNDPEECKTLKVVLSKFGIDSEVAHTAKDFILKMKAKKPDLCLVDLNLDVLGVGFTIIEAVRKVLGNDPILIVVSHIADRQAIANAIEIGANDFIVKPVDRNVLASKISYYVTTDQLLDAQSQLMPVPDGGAPATVYVDLEVQEIDEFGIKLISKHLLSKGVALYIDGPLIQQITGRAKPALMTVISTWVEGETGYYGALAEFDPSDDSLVNAARRWLANQNPSISETPSQKGRSSTAPASTRREPPPKQP